MMFGDHAGMGEAQARRAIEEFYKTRGDGAPALPGRPGVDASALMGHAPPSDAVVSGRASSERPAQHERVPVCHFTMPAGAFGDVRGTRLIPIPGWRGEVRDHRITFKVPQMADHKAMIRDERPLVFMAADYLIAVDGQPIQLGEALRWWAEIPVKARTLAASLFTSLYAPDEAMGNAALASAEFEEM
jgi:hypothetical protein